MTPNPALASGDALYQRAISMSLDPTPRVASGLAAIAPALEEVRHRTTSMTAAISAAEDAYAREATSPALLAVAEIRLADLFDALADRSTHIANPFPVGTGEAAAFESAEARVDELARRVPCSLFCVAWHHYRGALAIEPDLPRARSQIAAYGRDFMEICAGDPPGSAAPLPLPVVESRSSRPTRDPADGVSAMSFRPVRVVGLP